MAAITQTPDAYKANGQAQDFKSKVQVTGRDIEKLSHDAGARVGRMATGLADSMEWQVEAGNEYIKAHPGRSIAIAAATGALIGSLATLALARRK